MISTGGSGVTVCGIGLGMLLAEVSHILSHHCSLGMVGSSRRFFSMNGVNRLSTTFL
jgi:hypothetical protein